MKRNVAPLVLLMLGFASTAPAQPGESVQLAQADKRKFCLAYAAEAIGQNSRNNIYHCGKSGNRWSSNRADHINWCMAVQQDIADRETRIRTEELQTCTLGFTKTGSADAQSCRGYAATAVKSVAEAKRLRCNLTGARWSEDYGGHFGWCMRQGSLNTAVTKEIHGRRDQLEACKSARR